MSTASAVQVFEPIDTIDPNQDLSAMEVRWGIQVGVREKPISATECGLSHVPFAQFFPIKTFRSPREVHTTDEYKPREELATIPAGTAEAYLMDMLGNQDSSRSNWGLKTAFHNERDTAKLAVISDALFPHLSHIREIAPGVISDVCEGSDDLDYGRREDCTSCYWKWLNSDAVSAYIEQVAMQGVSVTVRDPHTGEITQTTVKPSIKELRTAHEVALASAKQALTQLEKTWASIAKEYDAGESGGRKDISDAEHQYRKDLHQTKPQDRQFAIAREFAKANSVNAGNNDEVLKVLAQGQIQMQENLARLTEVMAAQVASPATTTAAKDGKGK